MMMNIHWRWWWTCWFRHVNSAEGGLVVVRLPVNYLISINYYHHQSSIIIINHLHQSSFRSPTMISCISTLLLWARAIKRTPISLAKPKYLFFFISSELRIDYVLEWVWLSSSLTIIIDYHHQYPYLHKMGFLFPIHRHHTHYLPHNMLFVFP